VDRRLPHSVRAERHRLLGDARRLAIIEALEEGPRQIPELARILGVHPTTVRSHLERLLEAGVLEEEAGTPAGRGRPSKRYRLRQPLLGGDPELRLFVSTLVSLLRQAYGDRAAPNAEAEGARRGKEMAGSFRHPSFEQAVQEVVDTLERLSFAPKSPVPQDGGTVVDVRHCPFSVDSADPDGAIVCAFHEGLVKGIAAVASGEDVSVRVRPFVAPGLCRIELSRPTKGKPARRRAKPPRSDGAE
jgi:predicted ArsR family transcriptional regulator